MALPVGVLYPMNVKGEMKWGFASMIDIPEDERKNYPNKDGGFYEKRVDTDNPTIYEAFLPAINYINELIKKEQENGSLNIPDKGPE